LIAAKAEAAANLDRYLRIAADWRTPAPDRAGKDELAPWQRVGARDVYPVLDTIGLALTRAKQLVPTSSSLVGGIEMVLAQLKTGLAGHG